VQNSRQSTEFEEAAKVRRANEEAEWTNF